MKHIKIIKILFIALCITSCDLEPVPEAATSALGFYSNDSEIEAGIINIYDGIQGVNALEFTSATNWGVQIEFQLTEMFSDNTKTKSGEGVPFEFESFNVDATNSSVLDYYRSYFNVIFRANVVLENLAAATPANASKFEGEARFLRAYAYFNLVRLFGDLPFADKVIAPDDLTATYTRVPAAQIYDLIESDLTMAVNSGLDNSYRTRASKAAAQTLLAKVYLTLGKNYTEAASLCSSVIGSGYTLENNFNDVFYNENNSEVIFAIGYQADQPSDSQAFSAEWLNGVGRTSGLNYVTDDAKAAIDLLGGNRVSTSYREDPGVPGIYQVAKYLPNSTNPQSAGNDWIVLRAADVYLLHAEATMAGSGSTSDGTSVGYFQAVRNRAGLTAAVTVPITTQDLADERRVELAFENHRWFDLKRLGIASTVLGNFATANGFSFSGNDLLLPIPNREIDLSRGILTQNAGYN